MSELLVLINQNHLSFGGHRNFDVIIISMFECCALESPVHQHTRQNPRLVPKQCALLSVERYLYLQTSMGRKTLYCYIP